MANIEALARESYGGFCRDFVTAPDEAKPHIERITRVLLGNDPHQPVDINQDLFLTAFERLGLYIEEPTLLFPKAEEAVERLLEGRTNYFSAQEAKILAAYLCAGDILNLRELPENPVIQWRYTYQRNLFALPNPWYLSLPPYAVPIEVSPRVGNQYIQPRSSSLEECIDMLKQQEEPVLLLDGGTGSAAYPEVLKKQFGESLYTVGVGLSNQTLPVDEHVIRPMEMLPREWTNRFDVVVSNYALCYTLFPKKAIRELLRVLTYDREAYLDIAARPLLPWLGIIEIIAELVAPDIVFTHNTMRSHYAELNGFDRIVTCIKNLSDDETVYTAGLAKAGNGAGYAFQILKQRRR